MPPFFKAAISCIMDSNYTISFSSLLSVASSLSSYCCCSSSDESFACFSFLTGSIFSSPCWTLSCSLDFLAYGLSCSEIDITFISSAAFSNCFCSVFGINSSLTSYFFSRVFSLGFPLFPLPGASFFTIPVHGVVCIKSSIEKIANSSSSSSSARFSRAFWFHLGFYLSTL